MLRQLPKGHRVSWDREYIRVGAVEVSRQADLECGGIESRLILDALGDKGYPEHEVSRPVDAYGPSGILSKGGEVARATRVLLIQHPIDIDAT